ncbi:hypothetical protein [Helicobacter sp. 23-1045]
MGWGIYRTGVFLDCHEVVPTSRNDEINAESNTISQNLNAESTHPLNPPRAFERGRK